MTKKRILLRINIVVILAMAITFVAQCVNVSKIKKEQQLYFDSELNTVSHQIKEYKLTGHEFLLENVVACIHSSSMIANLINESSKDDEWQTIHMRLYSIEGAYYSDRDGFMLFIDELADVINRYDEHKSVGFLVDKLTSIDNRLTAMLYEKTTKAE